MAMAPADTPIDFGLLAGAGAPIRNYQGWRSHFPRGRSGAGNVRH